MRQDFDPSGLTDKSLSDMIDRHEKKTATDTHLYSALIAESMRRHSPDLSVEKSVAIIRETAQAGRFITYGELAAAHGREWQGVRYEMNYHLGDLVRYGLLRGWPMLTAIIVNKDNKDTGNMDESTLAGFVRCARAFKILVIDEQRFLKEQQSALRKWAENDQSTQVIAGSR